MGKDMEDGGQGANGDKLRDPCEKIRRGDFHFVSQIMILVALFGSEQSSCFTPRVRSRSSGPDQAGTVLVARY
jgi:hypothetical protein